MKWLKPWSKFIPVNWAHDTVPLLWLITMQMMMIGHCFFNFYLIWISKCWNCLKSHTLRYDWMISISWQRKNIISLPPTKSLAVKNCRHNQQNLWSQMTNPQTLATWTDLWTWSNGLADHDNDDCDDHDDDRHLLLFIVITVGVIVQLFFCSILT